jgi:hypothetical protein
VAAVLLSLIGATAPAASAATEPETLDGAYTYTWTRTSDGGSERRTITASLHLVRLGEHEWEDAGSQWRATGLVVSQGPPPCNEFLRETLAGSGTFAGRPVARLSGSSDFSKVVLSVLVEGDTTTTVTYSGGSVDNPCPENTSRTNHGLPVVNHPGCPTEPVVIRPGLTVGGSSGVVVTTSGATSIDFGCTDVSVPGTVVTVTGTLKGTPAKLEANAGGPYSTQRATTLALDGSRSRAGPGRRITSYKWRFAAAAPGCPVRRGGKTGVRPTVRPLCTVRATLTVSDGAGTDTATALVTVQPRTFAPMTLVHRSEPRKLNDAALTVSSDGACLLCVFGRNVCTLDGLAGDQTSGHLIHGGLVAAPGYRTARMHDPGGPSDGLYYVASHTLKVDRTSLINAKLWPGGSVYRVNHGDSARHAADVVSLFGSIKAHERFHSDLVREELERLNAAKKDPVTAIERLVRAGSRGLTTAADSAIHTADAKLRAATTDAKVKQRMRASWAIPARVLFPVGGGEYAEWSVRSLAEVGDGGAH